MENERMKCHNEYNHQNEITDNGIIASLRISLMYEVFLGETMKRLPFLISTLTSWTGDGAKEKLHLHSDPLAQRSTHTVDTIPSE